MKKCVTLLTAVFLTIFGLAQRSSPVVAIKGIVVDSATAQPMGFVTVTLQDPRSGKAIRKVVTRPDGGFLLEAPPGSPYSLVLSFVGYAARTISLGNATADIDAGTIMLVKAITQLQEAAVSAMRPVVRREIDRLTYDVQADPESVSLSALEMMRKIPLLTVDANDNILLNGGGNYKILINGRESAMMARSPSDVLKAMPASNIEKIEVITTPPAKYDAATKGTISA